MENKINYKDILLGFCHLLVAFTSIVVVGSILNYSLPNCFLFAGVSTLIFHSFTENKMPVFLGLSGLFIAPVLAVQELYGNEYIALGVIGAGLIYSICGILLSFFPDFIDKFFPEWLLSTAIILIGLNLIKIGATLSQDNMFLAGVTFFTLVLCDVSDNKYIQFIKLPFSIFIGVIIASLMGVSFVPVPQKLVFIPLLGQKFNLGAVLTIAIFAIPTMAEMLGDSTNTFSVIGHKMPWHKIFIANGTANVIAGIWGMPPYTTYSENTSFLIATKSKSVTAVKFGAIFAILVALISPLFSYIKSIPQPIFAGALIYLFALTITNGIKGFQKQKDVDYGIVAIMIGIAFLDFFISGIAISSTAIGIVVGILMVAVKTKINNSRSFI